MCLAQGPQRSDAGEARHVAPRSRVKNSTTEPLRSPLRFCEILVYIEYKQYKIITGHT